ncbi:MAG: hypothetical protein ABL877_10960 [Thiobacillus sp.]
MKIKRRPTFLIACTAHRNYRKRLAVVAVVVVACWFTAVNALRRMRNSVDGPDSYRLRNLRRCSFADLAHPKRASRVIPTRSLFGFLLAIGTYHRTLSISHVLTLAPPAHVAKPMVIFSALHTRMFRRFRHLCGLLLGLSEIGPNEHPIVRAKFFTGDPKSRLDRWTQASWNRPSFVQHLVNKRRFDAYRTGKFGLASGYLAGPFNGRKG